MEGGKRKSWRGFPDLGLSPGSSEQVGAGWGANRELVWGACSVQGAAWRYQGGRWLSQSRIWRGILVDFQIHPMIKLRLGALKGYWRMQGLGAEKSLAES